MGGVRGGLVNIHEKPTLDSLDSLHRYAARSCDNQSLVRTSAALRHMGGVEGGGSIGRLNTPRLQPRHSTISNSAHHGPCAIKGSLHLTHTHVIKTNKLGNSRV